MTHRNSFDALSRMRIGGASWQLFRLDAVPGSAGLPYSLKILLENLLRGEDGTRVTAEHIRALGNWDPDSPAETELQFTPARVLMQDFTGVPCVVDLAAMREAMRDLGGDPRMVNPLAPTDLVIDHSVIAESFGSPDARDRNVELEYRRNRERYQFLRWGQSSLDGFNVVPPGTGIVHQVNLERLARIVIGRDGVLFPDTVVGTDSHTTMVNGLGVLGWGVGGIEAEAALLGQPVSMLVPRVIGLKLSGTLAEGVTATDLVLTITELLRQHGVVGSFVEFHGPGISAISLADRATISNMCPEYGATAAIFPIDEETLRYLRITGRSPSDLALIEAYSRQQGLWHDPMAEPRYTQRLELDLATVRPCLAGPHRPQDRIPLGEMKTRFRSSQPDPAEPADHRASHEMDTPGHGSVVIAAITSCTSTSNPDLMLGAALLARNAVQRGLSTKPWVKTTLAPGSRVVTDYYDRAGLTPYLEKLGFHLVGFGCTTCIGNSGALPAEVSRTIRDQDLTVASVLSGNRNFEGRVHPEVKLNYLASPALVVAYAIAGTVDIDLTTEPLATDPEGQPVYLRDVWPEAAEIAEVRSTSLSPDRFEELYAGMWAGDERWSRLSAPTGVTFTWDPDSTYIRRPPYFVGLDRTPRPVTDIAGARVLASLGDSVTTDHISPAGAIKPDSPAGRYLAELGVSRGDLNSYGSRRGNHEIMVRGTFANVRLRNRLVPGVEGGFTLNQLTGERTTIYEAAMAYAEARIPLVVLAGREYGSGSSRDWAAKGPALLGIRAVLAESYERIHRTNLIGMGILPLQYPAGQNADSLRLTGNEVLTIRGITEFNRGGFPREATVETDTGLAFRAVIRIDTPTEADYYRHGGILQYVLRRMLTASENNPMPKPL